MLIEEIIEFELRGPEPPGRTGIPTTGDVYKKIKSSKETLNELSFTAKILHEVMYLAFSYLGQITYKI